MQNGTVREFGHAVNSVNNVDIHYSDHLDLLCAKVHLGGQQ